MSRAELALAVAGTTVLTVAMQFVLPTHKFAASELPMVAGAAFGLGVSLVLLCAIVGTFAYVLRHETRGGVKWHRENMARRSTNPEAALQWWHIFPAAGISGVTLAFVALYGWLLARPFYLVG